MVAPPNVRPEPPRRGKDGPYIIPDAKTGEKRYWTRATTFASAVEDDFRLNLWKTRMTAVGLARRPDLYAGVAAVEDPQSDDGKRKLDALCEQAKEFAGASTGSNLGTALHAFTQQLDMGRRPAVPAPWDKDVAAYEELIGLHGIDISPNYVERVVTVPFVKVAGTMDRLVRWNADNFVLDVKTGADLSYAMNKIAIQLALYAHAETVYDVESNRHFPMPKVDKERALVVHLPAGKATATLYEVDIRTGWQMAMVCSTVREYRKRKDLAHPLVVVS